MGSLGVSINTPFGAGGPGLDPYMGLVSEGTAYMQAIVRRWTTPRGTLYRHPDYGYDVRQWLNDGLDEADLPTIESALAEEAMADFHRAR